MVNLEEADHNLMSKAYLISVHLFSTQKKYPTTYLAIHPQINNNNKSLLHNVIAAMDQILE